MAEFSKDAQKNIPSPAGLTVKFFVKLKIQLNGFVIVYLDADNNVN